MDDTRAEQFTGRVLTDTAAAATVVMAALGDRLGLFRQLAQAGPATSGELASRRPCPSGTCGNGSAACLRPGIWSSTRLRTGSGCQLSMCPRWPAKPGPAFFGGVHQELIGAIQRYPVR